MKHVFFFQGAMVLVALHGALVRAQQPPAHTPWEEGLYFGFRGGYLEADSVEPGSGVLGFLTGVRLTPHAAIEGSVDFNENHFTLTSGEVTVEVTTSRRETTAFQLALNLYPFPYRHFSPYLLGGVGYFRSEYQNGAAGVSADDGGYVAGFGFDLNFSGWYWGILSWDARWLFTRPETSGGTRVQPDGLMVTVGFKFRF